MWGEVLLGFLILLLLMPALHWEVPLGEGELMGWIESTTPAGAADWPRSFGSAPYGSDYRLRIGNVIWVPVTRK